MTEVKGPQKSANVLPAHTPGPWVEFADNGETIAILPAMRAGQICDFASSVLPANARLIAAAPDQHAAGAELDRLSLVIESAVRNADPHNHEAVLAAIMANRAAIAKATGAE